MMPLNTLSLGRWIGLEVVECFSMFSIHLMVVGNHHRDQIVQITSVSPISSLGISKVSRSIKLCKKNRLRGPITFYLSTTSQGLPIVDHI